jgi:hypothetical protein
MLSYIAIAVLWLLGIIALIGSGAVIIKGVQVLTGMGPC